MEIDITDFFNNAEPMDYSASVAEIGQNAGADTWRAAVADAPDHDFLDDDTKREAFKSYISEFGAWDEDDINAWSHDELNALFIQFVSSDMREMGTDDWDEYQREAEAGQVSGRLFASCDRVYYSLD